MQENSYRLIAMMQGSWYGMCASKDEKTGMNIVLVEQDGTRSFLTNPHGTLRSLKVEHIQMPFPESAMIVCFASIFVFPKIGPDKLVQIFSQAKMQGKLSVRI